MIILVDMETIAKKMITTTNTDTHTDEQFQHEEDDVIVEIWRVS